MDSTTITVLDLKARGNDKFGSGAFGASRKRTVKGKVVRYAHQGVDLVTKVGDKLTFPKPLVYVREAKPYENEFGLTGGLWKILDTQDFIRVFYIKPTSKRRGDMIPAFTIFGVAQNIAAKHPGITNHIHFEYLPNMNVRNPEILLKSLR